MELLSSGSWTVYSKSDPRWNAHGDCKVGGFVMSSGANDHIERMKAILGEPPEDLQYSYMKD